jgi:hypothetical protein
MVAPTKPELRSTTETVEQSRIAALLAGLVAAACLAGIVLVVYRGLTGEWSPMTAALLLAVLTPPYAWTLYRMFLHLSGDRQRAKRNTVLAVGGTAAVVGGAVAVAVAVELLVGAIGFGLGGGSDSDSDSDSGSSDSSGSDSSGGWSSGWHFGGVGANDGGSGRYTGPGEAPHYAGGESATRGSVCLGCGRRWASNGLCAACSMPRL